MSIEIRGVTKQFGDYVALQQVSLDVPAGRLVALLGPSGSGKTTLLRIIAGLEFADAGVIRFGSDDVTQKAAKDRGVGFVFQHYALFRHMTVFENVAFGLRVRRRPNREVRVRVGELLSLVRLDGLGDRYPSQLSGGQRQRVALARALAVRPQTLLLDEPFGALDAKVRQELRGWLRRLHEEMPVTTLFVTHDQEEAFEVADRVVVMRSGAIDQVGTPQEVFEQPATSFVMDFLGNVNVFRGRVQNGEARFGPFHMPYEKYPHDEPRDATAYVRPHELDIERFPSHGSSLRALVLQISPVGPLARARLRVEEFGMEISVDLTNERAKQLELQPGDVVHVRPRAVRLFMPDLDYAI